MNRTKNERLLREGNLGRKKRPLSYHRKGAINLLYYSYYMIKNASNNGFIRLHYFFITQLQDGQQLSQDSALIGLRSSLYTLSDFYKPKLPLLPCYEVP